MNEFTKEELQDILSALQDDDSGYPFSIEEMALQHKIKSLIDNYCVHEHIVKAEGVSHICVTCGQMGFYLNE